MLLNQKIKIEDLLMLANILTKECFTKKKCMKINVDARYDYVINFDYDDTNFGFTLRLDCYGNLDFHYIEITGENDINYSEGSHDINYLINFIQNISTKYIT